MSRVVDAAAAAAPVAGEERATALFRAATGLAPVPAAGGVSVTTRLTRKLMALPAAGIAVGALVLSGGGLAIAATQGAVNVPFTGHDHRSDKAPAAPSSSNPGLSRTPVAPSTGSHGSNGAGGSATHLPSAGPSPSIAGLCRAFQAGAVPRKASNPAFAALTTAAGAAESVSGYCSDLIGTPSKPGHPTPTHPTPTHPNPTHPTSGSTSTHHTPHHTMTPPVARPTRAVSPTIPPKPRQAVTPTTKPRATRAAH